VAARGIAVLKKIGHRKEMKKLIYQNPMLLWARIIKCIPEIP
jgi:hypothetical protein